MVTSNQTSVEEKYEIFEVLLFFLFSLPFHVDLIETLSKETKYLSMHVQKLKKVYGVKHHVLLRLFQLNHKRVNR